MTRKRLYLETMQDVLGNVRMFVIDTPSGNASGIVPYLPLNELKPMPPAPDGREQVMRRFPILIAVLVALGFVLLNAVYHRGRAREGDGAAVRPGARRQGAAGPRLQDPVHPERRLLRQPHPGPRHQRARGDAARRPPAHRRRLRPLAHLRRQPVPPRRGRRRHAGGDPAAGGDPQRQRARGAGLGALRGGALRRPRRADEPHPRRRDHRGARPRHRDHRRAAEARRPAGAEPRRHLRPDEGRARARGRRRARPRQRGGAARSAPRPTAPRSRSSPRPSATPR